MPESDRSAARSWTDFDGQINTDPPQGEVRSLVTGVWEKPDGLSAVLVKLLSREGLQYELFLAPRQGDRVALARLLALSIVDRRIPIIHPTVMPRRPGMAFLRDDASFRHQVTRTFAPWVLREVDRIGGDLMDEAGTLLEELRGGPATRLRPPQAGAPLLSSDGWLSEFDPPTRNVDLSGFQSDWEGLPRHALLRKEYQRDRYMAHLDREELKRRARHIFAAFYQVDERGRITLDNDDPRTLFWMDRFAEIQQEYTHRSLGHSDLGGHLGQDQSISRGLNNVFSAAGRAVASLPHPSQPYIVKYGLRQHVEQMIEGKVRLAPAASYDDPSLNAARRDEELRRHLDFDMSILPFGTPTNSPSFVGTPATGRMRTTASFPRNFYVCCLSRRLRARLFNDFDADACLVIYDPEAFLRRFRTALATMQPDLDVNAAPVEYYDPLNVSPSEVVVPFWKHFRYACQEEVRITATPPENHSENLAVHFLELGELRDISETLFIG